ncbi:MAG TPA: DJ-1 family glyoxalase III [Mobilitalea sp.]|nr:DJ-1 family glyoxalase III [Mobilitalea sp.]
MSKVYIFLAEGYEEIEGLTVVDLLRRAEIEINMVSITGNKLVTGAHGITTVTDMLFEDANYEDADILVLPGGMPGTLNLMQHEGLDKLLRLSANNEKTLAAICAAPRVLGSKGLLEGKKATCYPGNEEYLRGAKYNEGDVVEDGNIVTSKGMGTAIDFALTLIKRLKNVDEAERIASSIIYRHYL